MKNKNKNKLATKLWHLAIMKRDIACQKCGKPAVDAHHIVHKTQGLALRYELDNGVALCRDCHNLDSTGKLRPWCIEHIGQEKYDELLKLKHGIAKIDIDEIIKKLEDK